MDKVIQIANICKDMCNVPNPIPGRIYYAKGCAPALNTCGGVEKTDVFMDKAKVTTPPRCATHSDAPTPMGKGGATTHYPFTPTLTSHASPPADLQTEKHG